MFKLKNIRKQETRRKDFQGTDMRVTNQPKVLMYHRIVDNRSVSSKEETCLHVDDFERQLKLLNHLGYTPITFRDYQLSLDGELRLPKKPVILTFDDGYEDIYRLAYPLLKEQGMKAVVFVLGDRSLRSNRWDTKNPGVTEAPLMSDEQILELHSDGFEIGAHTLSHSNLKAMNEGECYTEIYKPKLILEALLDSPIISFSYPYGLVDNDVKERVEEAGYQYACSVFSGPAAFGKDPLEIRRMTIHNSISLWGFMMRLMVPYEYVEWIWWKAHPKAGKNQRKNRMGKRT